MTPLMDIHIRNSSILLQIILLLLVVSRSLLNGDYSKEDANMLIEKKKVTELLPADYNPRKDLKPGDPEYEKLKRSIEQFGYVEPVIWNATTGCVVGGHQRLKVLQDMGMTEVDCVVVELDVEHEKALNVALNKISGEWDNDKLALLIADLQGVDFDVSLTGFEPAELDDLFKDSTKDNIKDDDFDVEAELQKPTFSKAGDLWCLGQHRLYCGDSTKPESYELLMAGKKANLVVTDPPYNVNYEGTAGKIQNDNMDNDSFYQFLLDAFTNMEHAMADDASIYVFHADTEGLNFRKAFSDAGFYLSGCCIWKKPSLVLGRSPYQWQHEPCLFGWKKSGKHQWYSGRKETTIWEFEKPKKNADHPTMKPIALIAYPIMNSSLTNCIVLDPFGGSGSTLIACEQTGRICHTIELDEKYADVIVKRYIEQVGSSDGVSVIRDGLTYSYDEIAISDESAEA
nr:MAG TPA: adenine specific DNA methyltransferase [Caudoviricetes sp.]